MDIVAQHANLYGKITVPGSKSHTIRALILATLADGKSTIKNPLPSADCLSTAAAVPLIGSKVELNLSKEDEPVSQWIVDGAGKNIHLPSDVVNVGNSGSLLYFLAPIVANFDGISIFTGDDSIKKRPVEHVLDVLNQLGARAESAIPNHNGCPIVIKGSISGDKVTTTGEISSQYISGLMMASILMKKKLTITLTNPKETPYLTMTQKWLEKVGVFCSISEDFKKIEVENRNELKAFDVTIPSDWEGVAFPLVAALMTDSQITIENVDSSGTQGDDAIVDILKSVGADIVWNKQKNTLLVSGGKKAKDGIGKLSTKALPNGELKVKMSAFPDAICALAVIATQIEGTVILEDAQVCRRKETDRLKVLTLELKKLGANIEEKEDSLVIKGGKKLHGGIVESYDDHRMAMSLSCLGLALAEGETLTVKDGECCAVSFPHFFEVMNKSLGANFKY
ncbi:3-phosphoshikimate 1-carboxyvinyltransferase [Treponema pectinovorum]|uniref:3-phosphoshikimate 1-carboxyvinyltransferase n=2 Tax=Treponema pectinovorum TaxID=164 RepID=UPI0011CB2272|nr:3-phosphoshikimate 1-carboxyvinyltransferase [Treponema pectinovorum]